MSNAASAEPTTGTVTVTDTLPAGVTPTGASGVAVAPFGSSGATRSHRSSGTKSARTPDTPADQDRRAQDPQLDPH
ncbi:hypothetical protein J7F03_10285 [Streptomyces sp. ISL-43]|nr:hypothetical protein [Streptomyces sp. ISL-43]